ncbi:anti-sigma B factor RsbW [Caldalkalibacillus mannanilyticus]|uniref:anti-sigma B factor RsbW n=1 Tax=Caldalkalibacillus mannanilyticus TaxID=1418 RepID=UPI000469D111|nr:anti-sigma B factor RsbW [Caldalkalibacillus mannanilyticus]
MKINDFVELKIPARAEYVGVVRLLISGVANRQGFSYDDIEDMKIAVAEACTNAITHAYKGHEGQIIVGCTVYSDRIEIMVVDHGESFNLEQIEGKKRPIDHHAPIEDLTEGGLGLFLIDTLMDKVEICNDSGIVIIMTKYKRRDEVERNDYSYTTTS